MNLRDKILNADDAKLTPVEVPEWGCTVYVRTLTGAGAAKVKTLQGDEVGATVALVIASACDETGKPIFTDADADALKGKAFAATNKVALAAITHNGMNAEAVAEAKN